MRVTTELGALIASGVLVVGGSIFVYMSYLLLKALT